MLIHGTLGSRSAETIRVEKFVKSAVCLMFGQIDTLDANHQVWVMPRDEFYLHVRVFVHSSG